MSIFMKRYVLTQRKNDETLAQAAERRQAFKDDQRAIDAHYAAVQRDSDEREENHTQRHR